MEGDSSKKGLNVNANAFVPNVNAPAFVPGQSWTTPPAAGQTEDAQPPTQTTDPVQTMPLKPAAESPEADAVPNGEGVAVEDEKPRDDWDDEEGDANDDGDDETQGESVDGDTPEGSSRAENKVIADKPSKDYLNIVFIGHVDAGKSTVGGQILKLTGMVDKRTLEKYEREAKEKNRESWALSWALDTNQEERDKGKTVECGRCYFETEQKHFTILDAPGHKSFVPSMIAGASQADVAVLVVSARKGEFETGFERGGQTREHAMLVKTAGVKHLIVLVNKMDDPTVGWDEERYNEIKEKLTPYLKKCGFNPKTDIYYLPGSGLQGDFILERSETCKWFGGPTFIEYLDSLPTISRASEGPLRCVLVDKYNDMGVVAIGKMESGVMQVGAKLTLMPNGASVQVLSLWSDESESNEVRAGESVKAKLRGVDEDGLQAGFILCQPDNLCHVGALFDAQVIIMEHKSIICPGYSAILHIHSAVEEVVVDKLLCLVDRKTNEKLVSQKPRFVKQDQACIMRLRSAENFCLERFKDFPQMGRFTLRDEGRTIAIGKVLKVIE